MGFFSLENGSTSRQLINKLHLDLCHWVEPSVEQFKRYLLQGMWPQGASLCRACHPVPQRGDAMLEPPELHHLILYGTIIIFITVLFWSTYQDTSLDILSSNLLTSFVSSLFGHLARKSYYLEDFWWSLKLLHDGGTWEQYNLLTLTLFKQFEPSLNLKSIYWTSKDA